MNSTYAPATLALSGGTVFFCHAVEALGGVYGINLAPGTAQGAVLQQVATR